MWYLESAAPQHRYCNSTVCNFLGKLLYYYYCYCYYYYYSYYY